MTAAPAALDRPALDPVSLALALMQADSTSGREGAAVAATEHILGSRGWRTRRIRVSEGRDDLIATSVDAPLVTLSTHLDTVPPYIPPRLDGSRLRGRGACDAKGIAAAMICAAERLRSSGVPVALLFVVGEETTHDGANAANAVATTSRILIGGEPTESSLALGTKGALRFTLRTEGRAAHSAYPKLGRSAIHDLVALLAELPALPLPRDELLGETTVNVGAISGGVADNVIAPSAEARVMVRLVTPSAEVLRLIGEWVGPRASIEPGPVVEAIRLGALPGFRTSVVAFATDVPRLDAWGTPYLYGPGSIHVAHTDDEYLEIQELHDAVGAYERLAWAALEEWERR